MDMVELVQLLVTLADAGMKLANSMHTANQLFITMKAENRTMLTDAEFASIENARTLAREALESALSENAPAKP